MLNARLFQSFFVFASRFDWRLHVLAALLVFSLFIRVMLMIYVDIDARLHKNLVQLDGLGGFRPMSSYRFAPAGGTDFRLSLPSKLVVDEVVTFIGGRAKASDVEIQSLNVNVFSGGLSELPGLRLLVTARGQYPGIKGLLSQLLTRYSSLGVEMAQMQAIDQANGRIDIQLSFVWYAQN